MTTTLTNSKSETLIRVATNPGWIDGDSSLKFIVETVIDGKKYTVRKFAEFDNAIQYAKKESASLGMFFEVNL